jgi:hypothetical protein
MDVLVGQAGFAIRGDISGCLDTLIGGSGRIISFDGLIVHPPFGDQFEDRLEEIEVEAQVLVDTLEEQELGLGVEAIITDEATDDRPIFLFDMGLIVFLVRARTGKGDLLKVAVMEEQVVDEFGAVVGVNAEQIEGQARAHDFNGFEDGLFGAW